MERSKLHFRHSLLLLFDLKKSAAEAHQTLVQAYGDRAPSYPNCRFWFQRFKSGNFDVNDKERPGQPKKFEDNDLQALLDENSAQTLKELADELDVTEMAVSKRLHAMGKIQKEGKWIPHELSPTAMSNRLSIAVSLLSKQKKKSFLWRIVTGDEKWIHYDNPKRKKSWVNPGQASTSQPKRNIHGLKLLLCIWWDHQGVVYHELLKPNETVTAEVYKRQLIALNDELLRKRPSIASNRRKVILLHVNARPHIGKTVKETLLQLHWEILPHPAYSPDIAPSDYHLFRSMQHGLAGTRFKNAEEVRKWVDDWIASKPISFYRDGIAKLPERWEKVVQNNGQYFD